MRRILFINSKPDDARAHARVCMYVCRYHRHKRVAWWNAMLEQAQRHDESWNGSLMSPLPLLPLTIFLFILFSLSLSSSILATPVLPSFSFFVQSFAASLALSRSFLFHVFLAFTLACSASLSISFILSFSLSRLTWTPLSHAPKERSAVVGEWTNALSAPAVEIKRTGHFLLSPHRNTTKVPSIRPSFVSPFRSLYRNPLRLLFSHSLLLILAGIIIPASHGTLRVQAKPTDACWPASRSRRARLRQNYIIAFSVFCSAHLGGLRASRGLFLTLFKSYFSRDINKYLPHLFNAV